MTVDRFESFVLEKSSRLYRYAYFLIRNREDAHDTLQETFADLWKMNERLDSYQSPEALALNIIRNKCLDRIRFSYRKDNLEKELRKQLSGSASETPETILEGGDAQSLIDEIVRSLPAEQQEILFLKNVEGLTCEEISGLLQIKVNTVEVTLSRIRKNIRSKYDSIQHYKAL